MSVRFVSTPVDECAVFPAADGEHVRTFPGNVPTIQVQLKMAPKFPAADIGEHGGRFSRKVPVALANNVHIRNGLS